jgi:hypothetical protein
MPAAASASSAPLIYWTTPSANTIGVANLDGTGVNTTFIAGANNPAGIAVDGQHIYWINRGNHTIGRANLDGTGVNQSFITPAHVGLVGGIAVNGKFIYWGEGTDDTIGRANVDGTGVPNDSFITGGTQTEGVAVDGNHIYWTNAGNGSLGEATLDGSVISQTLGFPGAFMLALDGQHLYFSNVNPGGEIWRAKLDDTNGDTSFILAPQALYGVVVDSRHVYWANSSGTTIGVADLDGTGVDQSFIGTVSAPLGVAVSVPVASVSTPATFASTPQGTLAAPRTVTVSNAGQQVLTVSGLSFAGPNAADFLIGSNTCMGGIDPGSSCQLQVYFAPGAAGARSATLLVTSNDIANSPISVPLSGTGGALPQGPAGQNGSNGSNGSNGANGAQGARGPAGKVELVVCTKVKHKPQKCTTRLVSGPVKFKTARTDLAARISRAGTTYATGVAIPTGKRSWQVVLTHRARRLVAGRYTLTLTTHDRRHRTVQRRSITISRR